MKRCKGAIFDMDGTLLDSMEVWDRLTERFVSPFGVTITQEDLESMESKTLLQNAQYFTQRYPAIGMTPEQMRDGLDKLITERYGTIAKPRTGVIAFLNALRERGVKMAVATLTSRKHAEEALRQFDMLGYFDVFLTVEEVGVSKTEPDIYLAAASAMDCTPQESIVFEDAPYAAETAKRAGFLVCGVEEATYHKGHSMLREVSDFYVVESFEPLLKEF